VPRWILVGTPGESRVSAFQAALARCGQAPAVTLPWLTAIDDPAALGQLCQPGDVVRIESPGSNGEVWQRIAAHGGWRGPEPPAGAWRPGHQWFAGLRHVLTALGAVLAERQVHSTHDCQDILAMTDKAACRARLADQGVPVPPAIDPPTSPDALRRLLAERRWHQVFVKPRWGSSGAGVLAWRRAAGGMDAREQITTTVLVSADGTWRNSKRQRTYTDPTTIDHLLQTVLDDGAVVERWIPKLTMRGGPLDLRLVVIDGQIQQRVARVGAGPITNLHLDAERTDVDDVLACLPRASWSRITSAAQAAAAAFPRSRMLGLDCLVTEAGMPYILEANAWGDHLPRLRHAGFDAQESQIHAVLAQPAVPA
jgi:hypothetical protein